jgi:hypothetical protein
MGHVRALAVEIGIRWAWKPGARRAADYIAGEIRKIGWTTELQEFPLPEGGVSWNVIGKPPGFDETKPYLLVGGHYDTKGGPGADDNATGVAISLEAVRVLSMHPARLPVVFIAFGAEEVQPVPGKGHHHIGSRYYVPHMSDAAKKNLVSYLDLDEVGRGSAIYCGRMSTGSREGTERCLRLGAQLGILTVERVTPDWSDNGSFLLAGLNAGWLWTGVDQCCYHSPKDTIDRVQPAAVARVGRLTLAYLRSY